MNVVGTSQQMSNSTTSESSSLSASQEVPKQNEDSNMVPSHPLEKNDNAEVGGVLAATSDLQFQMQSPPFPLYILVQRLIKNASGKLISFIEHHSYQTSERKREILSRYFQITRHQFIRLLVLIRWAKSKLSLLDQMRQSVSSVEGQTSAYSASADSLFYNDDLLKSQREPVFDIPTAIEVLTTNSYNRLPYAIQKAVDPENLDQRTSIHDNEVKKAVHRLTDVIRMNILKEKIPEGLEVISIQNGQIILRATEKEEFEITLTMDSNPMNLELYWKILSLRILVSEHGVSVSPLFPESMKRLKDTLQARLFYKVLDTPFVDVYNTIHHVCVHIAMDILATQAYRLQENRYNGIISAEYSENPEAETALFVYYWKNATVMNLTMDGQQIKKQFQIHTTNKESQHAGLIKVYINAEKQIQLYHDPSIQSLEFNIKYSSLNMSSIIMTSIQSHCILRLKTVRDYLLSQNIFGADSESRLIITHDQITGIHRLQIPMFEGYHLTLFVNWQNGQFNFELICENGSIIEIKQLQRDNLIPSTHSSLITMLKTFEFQLNRNLSRIVDILVSVKKCIIQYCYHRASAMLGLDSQDYRNYSLIQIRNETDRELYTKNCIYIKYPHFPRVYILVSLNYNYSEYPELYASHILDQNFQPLVHLLLEAGKSKKFSIFKIKSHYNEDQTSNKRLYSASTPSSSYKRKRISLDFYRSQIYFSAYHHLLSVIQCNTGTVCRYQLLHQLTHKVISYEYEISDADQRMIVFPVPSAFPSLKQTGIKETKVKIFIENQESFKWHAELIVGTKDQFLFPIIVDREEIIKTVDSCPKPMVYHLKTFDPHLDEYSLSSHICYVIDDQKKQDIMNGVIPSPTDNQQKPILESSVMQSQTSSTSILQYSQEKIIKLRFSYGLASYPQGISEFISDMKAVNSISKIAASLYSIRDRLEALNVRIQCLSHIYILLDYGSNYQYHAHITWSISKRNFSVTLHPSNGLESYFEQLLNEASVEKLLLILKHVSIPLFLIKSKLSPQHCWYFIPRSSTHLRVIYKSYKYEYSMQFTCGNIKIEEVQGETTPHPSTGFRICSVTGDEQKLEEAIEKFNRYASSAYLFDMIASTSIAKNAVRVSPRKFNFTFNDITYNVGLDNESNDLQFSITGGQFTNIEKQYLSILMQRYLRQCGTLGEDTAKLFLSLSNLLRCSIPPPKQLLQFIIQNSKEYGNVIPIDSSTNGFTQDNSVKKNFVEVHLVVPTDLRLPRRIVEHGSSVQPGIPCPRQIPNESGFLFRFISKTNLNHFVDLPITTKQRGSENSISFQILSHDIKLGSLNVGKQTILEKIISNLREGGISQKHFLIHVIEKLLEISIDEIINMGD